MAGRTALVCTLLAALTIAPWAPTAPVARAASCAPGDPGAAATCLVTSLGCELDAANGKGCTGPYGGFLVQGLTMTHTYASPPPEILCFVPVKWIVTLSYSPPGDVVTLGVLGRDAVAGTDGSAVIEFIDVCWTRFTIQVTGTEVALLAQYTVTVEQGNAFT